MHIKCVFVRTNRAFWLLAALFLSVEHTVHTTNQHAPTPRCCCCARSMKNSSVCSVLAYNTRATMRTNQKYTPRTTTVLRHTVHTVLLYRGSSVVVLRIWDMGRTRTHTERAHMKSSGKTPSSSAHHFTAPNVDASLRYKIYTHAYDVRDMRTSSTGYAALLLYMLCYAALLLCYAIPRPVIALRVCLMFT